MSAWLTQRRSLELNPSFSMLSYISWTTIGLLPLLEKRTFCPLIGRVTRPSSKTPNGSSSQVSSPRPWYLWDCVSIIWTRRRSWGGTSLTSEDYSYTARTSSNRSIGVPSSGVCLSVRKERLSGNLSPTVTTSSTCYRRTSRPSSQNKSTTWRTTSWNIFV